MNNFRFKFLKSEKEQSGASYGSFLIENLKPGQGITLGNQLRRVLLNEVGGNAISAVSINGYESEFYPLLGIREDILEILLNLKGIVIESKTQELQYGSLKVKGPLVVTADLIQLPPGLKIVNPNHYIATISSPTVLEMEFKIEYGTGYRLASYFKSKPKKKENDSKPQKQFIKMDAVFMPVQKANFKIENFYKNGSMIDEKLFFEIWTNGSISPIKAIDTACKLIIQMFKNLVEAKNFNYQQEKLEKINKKPVNPYQNITIEELNLSVRPYNCLKKAKINTIADLLDYSLDQLLTLKSFGKKSANEVVEKLKNKLGILFE